MRGGLKNGFWENLLTYMEQKTKENGGYGRKRGAERPRAGGGIPGHYQRYCGHHHTNHIKDSSHTSSATMLTTLTTHDRICMPAY